MAFLDYLPKVVQGAGAILGIDQGKKDARLLRAQGRVAQQQAVADADAISREYRQLAGRQATAIAQSGGSYEGSAAKVLHQSESLAMLDRLNTMYHGQLRKRTLQAEASSTEKRANFVGLSQLASIGSELYTDSKTRKKAGR